MTEPNKRVCKSWGEELWLINKSYCGKILRFDKGKKCSFHYHKVKDELFYVNKGRFLLRYGMKDRVDEAFLKVLEVGDTFHVPTGLRHQMEALEEGELIEFSTHHEDSDSYRLADV